MSDLVTGLKDRYEDSYLFLESEDRWWEDARCKGMDHSVFLLPKGRTPPKDNWRRAAAVCAVCTVADKCREEAIREGERWMYRNGPPQGELREKRKRAVKGIDDVVNAWIEEHGL